MKEQFKVSEEALQRLRRVSVSTATHMLVQHGFHNAYMKGIMPLTFPDETQRVAGRAVTVRFIPLREDLVKEQYDTLSNSPHRTAIESIEKDDFLVMDTGGCMDTGVLGDIFTRRIRALGGRGVVIDGCVRDLERIRELGFPVFAKGVHGGAIPRSLMSVDFNEPVTCGGVPVIHRDVILADRDGVVSIPPQMVEEVIRICSEHDDLEERWIKQKLDEGASLHTHYPPNGDALAEFNAWKEALTSSAGSN